MVKKAVQKATARIKIGFTLLALWGIVFSFSTLLHLTAAFGFDGSLAQSGACFKAALSEGHAPCTPDFWAAVNRAYDREKIKWVPYSMAWALRLIGFRVLIVTSRPSIDSEGLAKDWRYLAPGRRFIFTGRPSQKKYAFENGRVLLALSSRASDLRLAREAGAFPVRIDAGPDSAPPCAGGPGPVPKTALPLPLSSF